MTEENNVIPLRIKPPVKDEGPPPSDPVKNYKFVFKGGESKVIFGYLVITAAFAAVGKGVGNITFAAPWDSLDYVEMVETVH